MPTAADVELTPGASGLNVGKGPGVSQAVTVAAGNPDGNVLGFTQFFLNGEAREVGTGETNLGGLVAEANLRIARSADPATVGAILSASTFKGSIGFIAGTELSSRLPPSSNRGAGKPFGAVSQLDVETALGPNQGLSLVTVTAAQLLQLLEYGVADYTAETPSSRFPQVAGLRFSFDPSRQAQVLDGAGALVMPGERVRNLGLLNADTSLREVRVRDGRSNADTSLREVLVRDGRLLGDPNRLLRLVLPSALASGGDGYRLDLFGTDRVDLRGDPALQEGGVAFAEGGTVHDSVAEYLRAFGPTNNTRLALYDSEISDDRRIQNLAARFDTALLEFPRSPNFSFSGNPRDDFLQSNFPYVEIDPASPSRRTAIILSATEIAELAAPLAGERTFARIINPEFGSSLVLPTGFEGLIAAGENAVTLSASTSDAVLIGNNGRNTLRATGARSTLVAGEGASSLLAQGAGNMMIGGAGDDSMAGGGTFFTGAGRNLVSLNETGSVVRAEGRDTVFTGLAGPASDTVGATGFSEGTVIFAGAGRLTFVNADASSTVTGGAGGSATIFGGTGGGIFQGGSAGGNQLIGGSRIRSRVVSPGESNFTAIIPSYPPRATVTFYPPAATGTGTVTLVGGGDGDLLYADGLGQNILFAGPGNSTLIGGANAGASVFVGAFGTAATTVQGGNGDDIVFAGTGRLVADGGAGTDLFVFAADRPGGTTVINGFNPGQDRLALLGFDPAEPSRALLSAQVANDSVTLTLVDNTRVTFAGVTDIGSGIFI